MTRRVLVTRAAPGAEETAARVRALGATPVLAPMLRIETRKANVDVANAQALVFTSATGVRAFAAQTGARALPAICVGAATASAAREAGFFDVRAGGGDGEALAPFIAAALDPRAGALIHVSGAHVAIDLAGVLQARGFSTERRIFYEAIAAKRFADDVLARLRARPPALDIVLFHSARAAAVFCGLARQAAPNAPGALAAACLSQNVANAASVLPWRRLILAERPSEAALLAAALPATVPDP